MTKKQIPDERVQQDFGVYPNLNALEFLTYMATIKGLGGKSAKRRIKEAIS